METMVERNRLVALRQMRRSLARQIRVDMGIRLSIWCREMQDEKEVEESIGLEWLKMKIEASERQKHLMALRELGQAAELWRYKMTKNSVMELTALARETAVRQLRQLLARMKKREIATRVSLWRSWAINDRELEHRARLSVAKCAEEMLKHEIEEMKLKQMIAEMKVIYLLTQPVTYPYSATNPNPKPNCRRPRGRSLNLTGLVHGLPYLLSPHSCPCAVTASLT